MESGGVEVGECSLEVIAASPTRAHTHSPVQRSSGILVRSISDLTHPTLLWLFSEAGGASIVCLGEDSIDVYPNTPPRQPGEEWRMIWLHTDCAAFCCCRCFLLLMRVSRVPALSKTHSRRSSARYSPKICNGPFTKKERERERQARSAYSSTATKKSHPDADVSLLKEIRRS